MIYGKHVCQWLITYYYITDQFINVFLNSYFFYI